MTRLLAVLLACLLLAAPARADQFQTQLRHQSTGNALQDLLCDTERGYGGSCVPFATLDRSAHRMTALKSFLDGTDGSGLSVGQFAGAAGLPLAQALPYFDVRLFRLPGDADYAAATARAFQACYAAGGGVIWFPPKGSAYDLGVGVVPTGNTCGVKGVGVANWPGPIGPESSWTAAGSWLKCSITVTCIDFHGSGFVEGVNFWEAQPDPSVTPGTPWTPNDSPFRVVFRQNFSHISDTQFANVSRAFDFEYPNNANIAGSYSYFQNIFGGGFRIGVRFADVNDTMHCANYHARHLWQIGNSNVIDWMEGADGPSSGAIGWDIQYLDNIMCEGVEFYKNKTAFRFTDGTAVYGTGTLTHAAENLTIVNLQLNQVVQAIDLATGATAVSGNFTNTVAQSDTDTNRAAPYFFNLASNNADFDFNGLQIGDVGYNLFSLGAGAEGRMRVRGLHVGSPLPGFNGSGYGYLNSGGATHAFVLAKNSRLDLPDGTQTIQPGPYGGSLIACAAPASGQPANSNCGTVLAVVPAVTPTAP